jgi:predicted porin
MKKVLLLGASALALGVGSNAAFAEDPLKVTLSGTGQEWFGYASNNKTDVGTVSKAFAQSNNSFSLNGSTKLDNGLTVGVSFSMNASPGTEGSQAHLSTSGNTQVANATAYSVGTGAPETNIVSFSGGFGSFSIGWQPNAALATSMDAPSFGVGGLSWGRWAGWIQGPSKNNLIAGSGETSVYDDYWANKIVYSTPAFMGFQLTGSFTPNMASTDSGPSSSGANGGWGGDASALALTYGGDFGSAKVKAQAAYVNENFNSFKKTTSTAVLVTGTHVDGYQGGLSVSAGGFTVGGAVADRVVSTHGAATPVAAYNLKTNYADGITYDVGVSYTTGPWGVAANYYHSEAKNNNIDGNTTTAGKAHDDYYGIDFQYTLGPGISVALENALVNYKVESGSATADKENKGWFSVLSTTVNF